MVVRFMVFILLPFMFFLLSESTVVKIIKTEHGDIYDCIDFYKQLALQHPSLKTHNFHPQMRPHSSPKRMKGRDFSRQIDNQAIRLKDGGCPDGTVPVRRMGKDELSQLNLIKHNSTSSRSHANGVYRQPGTIFAVAYTESDPGTKSYNGVGAYISVYNPHIGPGQYSSAQVIIQDGSDMIEIGWTVNPTMYKNNATRLFVYTTAGDTHCFNSHCGFVIVNTQIPIDAVIKPISTVGGDTYEYQFFVYQDQVNGNWWLELGHDSTIIGFWPKQFFTGMAQSASYVACGGEAYQPPGQPTSIGKPEMGSGNGPYWMDPAKEAYCKHFVLVNEAHEVVYASGTKEFGTDDDYVVIDNPRKQRPQHYVFFGGPHWPRPV